jgi:hypothetical protein
MAVSGLDRWDFLSYCPGDSPLLLMIERDDFTDQLESGLKILVSEMAKMKSKLSDLWNAEFLNAKSPSVDAKEKPMP